MPSSCVVHQLQLHHNFITISLGIHCCFQLPYLLVHNTNTLTQPIRARRIGRLLYYATSGTLSLFKSRSGRFGLSLDVSPSLQYGLSHSYSCKIELWPGEFSLHITFQNIEGLQAVLQREYSRFKDFRFSLREPICGVHPSGLLKWSASCIPSLDLSRQAWRTGFGKGGNIFFAYSANELTVAHDITGYYGQTIAS